MHCMFLKYKKGVLLFQFYFFIPIFIKMYLSISSVFVMSLKPRKMAINITLTLFKYFYNNYAL